MKTDQSAESPQQSMLKWDPEYRHHRVPEFMVVNCRCYLKEKHGFRPGMRPEVIVQEAMRIAAGELNSSLFDHWGDVPRGNLGRAFLVQPYGNFEENLATAQKFAKAVGVPLIESRKGAPWHEDANLFVFAITYPSKAKQP